MRRLFLGESSGLSSSALRWGEAHRSWRRIQRGVYAEGPEDPSELDLERAQVVACDGVARGGLAGVLLGLDSVELDGRPLRRDAVPLDRIIKRHGLRCASGLQTLIDLAATLDDERWEQALESALRKKLTSIAELEAELPRMARSRRPGCKRIRRVLTLRPLGAPPTESLLETLFVQLARDVPGLPPPTRQLTIYDKYDQFVARVDLCWPELGLFIELDGQQHKGQPVYDAIRQTRVTEVMGWRCGRFTWTEVVHYRRITTRRLAALTGGE